jgi:hypothetical protein
MILRALQPIYMIRVYNPFEIFLECLNAIIDFMRTPIECWAFSFSLWDVVVFTIIASIILWAVAKIIGANSD